MNRTRLLSLQSGWAVCGLLWAWMLCAGALEERMVGVLERTEKPGACAQITDVLRETYYVLKTADAEKACLPYFGKKVLLKGVVEQRRGDMDFLVSLNQLEPYRPESAKPKPEPDLSGKTYPLPPPPEERREEKSRPEGTSGAQGSPGTQGTGGVGGKPDQEGARSRKEGSGEPSGGGLGRGEEVAPVRQGGTAEPKSEKAGGR